MPDPATDSAGRLGKFLNKTIGDLKPKGPEPMTNSDVTAQWAAAPKILDEPAKSNELVPSLTGALTLAGSLKARIEKSKARHLAAGDKINKAFDKLDSASEALESTAAKADAEADAAMALLGQVSNLGS
jgi:hypothetical protein